MWLSPCRALTPLGTALGTEAWSGEMEDTGGIKAKRLAEFCVPEILWSQEAILAI